MSSPPTPLRSPLLCRAAPRHRPISAASLNTVLPTPLAADLVLDLATGAMPLAADLVHDLGSRGDESTMSDAARPRR